MLTKRTRKAAVLAAAAAMTPGAAWGLPAPAGAGEVRTTSPDRVTPPAAPEAPDEATAAELYARDFDVDGAEARERLAQQGRLSATLGQLRQLAGDRLAGAWIEHRPDLRGIVRLTGPVADAASFEAVVAGSPVPVEVRTDAPRSLAQLETERAKVEEELARTLPEASAGIHEQSGSVMVYAPATDRAERQASQAALPEVRAVTDAPVRVTYEPDPPRLQHDYGGDRTAWAGTPMCTTGFSVTHGATGQQGIVTAGHCTPPLNYRGWNGELPHLMTRVAVESSTVTDVAVYTTSHDTYPEFYGESRTARHTLSGATLWSAQVVGGYVCHQGITTGHSCGTITDRAFDQCGSGPSAPFFGPCEPHWVRVEGPSLACAGGDSGGPWFNGTSAYGIHHGGGSSGTAPGQCSIATYAPIDFKYTHLGSVLVFG